MNCCDCQKIDKVFDRKRAEKDMNRYRDEGPDKTTGILIKALRDLDLKGKTLIDIGGGVGVIQLSLLESGVASAVSVEASEASIKVAKDIAKEKDLGSHIIYRQGDFVEMAKSIDPADIVTLDKVICCYADMRSLVSLSAKRARETYAVIYPRDTWWVKTFFKVISVFNSSLKDLLHIHSTDDIEQILEQEGFKKTFQDYKRIWQIAVFQRS